jgi:polyphenol oxidase
VNSDWLIPDWPAPPQVQAVFSSRGISRNDLTSKSGVSLPPFDAFNLGDHVGDDPTHVMANRHMLQTLLGVKPVYLKQVHGTDAVTLTPQTPHGVVADACITTEKKLACTIMVADCLPVLFTDVHGSFVAAAHAGWRGLADGVLINTLKSTIASINTASVATKIIAWLGPCIGPAAFEVGAEVKAAFAEKLPQSESFFKRVEVSGEASVASLSTDKYLADLAGLARLQLTQFGLGNDQIFGNDSTAQWCTVGNPLRYFSHRRDAVLLGSSGRMVGCIWMA